MPPASYINFDNKNYQWKNDIDYRKEKTKYKIGKGEQGVLICQPYKSEIGPHWKFRTVEIAERSSETIYNLFLNYLSNNDFIGADLSRKYLQMGFTRARRYTNYKGGRKYIDPKKGITYEKGSGDPEKAVCANIFLLKYQEAESNPKYKIWKSMWKIKYG